MTKIKIILIAAFLLTFAAGLVGGVALRFASPRHTGRSWLTKELNLTPEQQQKMHDIWTSVIHGSRETADRKAALEAERDAALSALFTEDQARRYDDVMQDYARKIAELGNDRETRFQEARRRTEEILNEEQLRKYREMLKNRGDHEHHRPGGGGKESGQTQ